jgi:hypothetical protein
VAVRGYRAPAAAAVGQFRQQLLQDVTRLLQQLRSHFFDVHQSADRLALVTEYCETLKRDTMTAARAIVENRGTVLREEVRRMAEQLRMNDAERASRAADTRSKIAEWDGIGERVDQLLRAVVALESEAAGAKRPAGAGHATAAQG